jgi:hypothetical protein
VGLVTCTLQRISLLNTCVYRQVEILAYSQTGIEGQIGICVLKVFTRRVSNSGITRSLSRQDGGKTNRNIAKNEINQILLCCGTGAWSGANVF